MWLWWLASSAGVVCIFGSRDPPPFLSHTHYTPNTSPSPPRSHPRSSQILTRSPRTPRSTRSRSIPSKSLPDLSKSHQIPIDPPQTLQIPPKSFPDPPDTSQIPSDPQQTPPDPPPDPNRSRQIPFRSPQIQKIPPRSGAYSLNC